MTNKQLPISSSGSINHSPNKSNTRELRQRRARITTGIAAQRKAEEEFAQRVGLSTTKSSSKFAQIFLVLITGVVVSIGGILQYTQPTFFRKLLGKKKKTPTFYFATKYPDDVILDRDLPRFFRSLSIATPENEFARNAVSKVSRSRTQLKKRLGTTKAILRAWDSYNIDALIHRGICGDDFTRAYQTGSDQRKHDLLMWCLLAARVVEGFFLESVEMLDSPLHMTRNRGVIVKKLDGGGAAGVVEDGYGAFSNSFYLHPRMNKTSTEWIPSKMLAMVISTPEDVVGGPAEASEMLQRYLYELVSTDDVIDDFIVLEEVCQVERPERALAIDCPHREDNSGCCYFVLPEMYGGNFKPRDDDY